MGRTFTTTRRVAFRDTDAAGIAHFSAFLHYMEDTEHEFWRLLGLSVVTQDEQGHLSWPRVSCTCNYTGAVKFEDLLDIDMTLERLGEKSLTFEYNFRHGKRDIAHGRMTTVCCRFDDASTPHSIPIPPAIREQIESYFAEE